MMSHPVEKNKQMHYVHSTNNTSLNASQQCFVFKFGEISVAKRGTDSSFVVEANIKAL